MSSNELTSKSSAQHVTRHELYKQHLTQREYTGHGTTVDGAEQGLRSYAGPRRGDAQRRYSPQCTGPS